jgi:hypothetical protein
MRTDDDIATLLCRGFARATADLDPPPAPLHVVRSRHARERRRRLVVGVAVPAAALAAGSGLALAGHGASKHTPSRTAVAVAPPSTPATRALAPNTTSVTSAPIRPASYRVVLSNHSTPANCTANASAPIAKTANPRPGVWFFTNGQCVFVGVGGADTKPADAAPLQVEGYPGVYSTLKNSVRTIYAPGIGGRGWWVLDMPATAPQDLAVRLIVPAN